MQFVLFLGVALSLAVSSASAPVTFHKDFQGGSFDRIEIVGSNHIRCHVEGQTDQRGRNRQATWYYFQADGVSGRELTVSITNLVGEYNDKPGAVSMNARTIPVYSHDGVHWQHFATMAWNEGAKEATVKVSPERDSVWIAHVPPYTVTRLDGLLSELKVTSDARIELIGKTVEHRDLPLVTVTDSVTPDRGKKVVWFIARQHAWEAGTSFVMEGALRFITSRDPYAKALRAKTIFKFLPMMAQDGVVGGKVRFNLRGYDINRHWNDANWESKTFRDQMPEIWAAKKAIFAWLDSRQRIDLMVNLHNTETEEYLRTQVGDSGIQELIKRLEKSLVEKTSFDPDAPLGIAKDDVSDTNSLWHQRRIPVVLMEQRISFSTKLGRAPTVDDRLRFGRDLIAVMAESVAVDAR